MRIGLIGLGRMGANMAARLIAAGHEVVGYARSREHVASFVALGGLGATSERELVAQLASPRVIWLMVPAAAVDHIIETLRPLLGKGDVIVDAGNSHYHHDIRRAAALARDGIHHVDVGTSGGVWGKEK